MSNPAIRGRGVVYGADGQLVLAGRATWTGANSAHSVGANIADKTLELEDSSGKVCTVINVEDILDVEFELQAGGTAATLANAATQTILPRKNDKLITTLFAASDLNGTFRIMEASNKGTNNGVVMVSIKARKNEADFSAAALSA